MANDLALRFIGGADYSDINYAYAEPSLDLQFAGKKSLIDQKSGNNLITFTRASSATYVNSTGTIQSAVTNLLLRSEEFDIGVTWPLSGSTLPVITVNAGISPNGSVTADLWTRSITGSSFITQAIGKPATVTQYTFSVFVKKSVGDFCALRVQGTYPARADVVFNIASGSISSAANVYNGFTGASASIIPYQNNWYRLIFTATSDTSTNYQCIISFNSNNAVVDGTDSASNSAGFLWGAQLEQSSTVGEYIPTTSTINSAPRFDHNPTTGESLGLLVEESRTNLLTNSESLTAGFTQQNTTVTSDATTAPDGAVTADLSVPNTTSASHASFRTNITFAVSTSYALSVFVKPFGYTNFQLAFTSGFNNASAWANFILSGSGSLGFTGASGTASIQALTNGWYRCSLVATSGSSATTGGPAIVVLDSNRNARDPVFAGNATDGIYLWGAQLEAGAFPTSYIPTTAAAATRSADVASITGANFSSWYNQTEGTVFADAIYRNDNSGPIAFFNDGSYSNLVSVQRDLSVDRWQVDYYSAGSRQALLNLATNSCLAGQASKIAATIKLDNYAASANGGTIVDDNVGSLPISLSRVSLGFENVGNSSFINGTIRRLTYFPQKLSNANLQRMTQ